MKKIIFTLTVLSSLFVISQVTNEGEPISWSKSLENTLDYIQLPEIDLNKIVLEDVENDQLPGLPYRIGVPIDASYNTQNSGVWNG